MQCLKSRNCFECNFHNQSPIGKGKKDKVNRWIFNTENYSCLAMKYCILQKLPAWALESERPGCKCWCWVTLRKCFSPSVPVILHRQSENKGTYFLVLLWRLMSVYGYNVTLLQSEEPSQATWVVLAWPLIGSCTNAYPQFPLSEANDTCLPYLTPMPWLKAVYEV